MELDYHEITKEKIKFITNSKLLSSFFPDLETEKEKIITNNKKRFLTEEYKLMNCDLSNPSEILNCLNASNLDKKAVTIVIAECLFVYIANDSVISMLSTISDYFNNCLLLYYDLINPFDDFGKMMIKNLKTFRNLILASYEDCPTLEHHNERVKKGGFNDVECVEMLKYFNNYIDSETLKRVNSLELVDELEEWNLLLMHACFGLGLKNSDGVEVFKNFKLHN